jgi:hypothetical protein
MLLDVCSWRDHGLLLGFQRPISSSRGISLCGRDGRKADLNSTLVQHPLTAQSRRRLLTTLPRADRARIIAAARAHRFRVTGFHFSAPIEACLVRNRARPAPERVPDAGLRDALRRFEPPVLDEGFDRLFEVLLDGTGFAVSEWRERGAG